MYRYANMIPGELILVRAVALGPKPWAPKTVRVFDRVDQVECLALRGKIYVLSGEIRN